MEKLASIWKHNILKFLGGPNPAAQTQSSTPSTPSTLLDEVLSLQKVCLGLPESQRLDILPNIMTYQAISSQMKKKGFTKWG